ncbi:hypothetical protein [Actinoplanes rectilineatus]|uniref:hypothetical protein n=1 Tax=Actinoplanes rectilineatus TaxID=113571 RepID=UPI0005F2E533|nr:hypothetical protein [Actinoplanes rectilineatus]
MTATVTAIGLATALGATPAQAQSNVTAYSNARGGYTSQAAVTRFTAYGDKITLFDQAADGAGVHGDWFYTDVNGREYEQTDLYWGGGAGTSHTWDFDIPENVIVTVIACIRDNGDIIVVTCDVQHSS